MVRERHPSGGEGADLSVTWFLAENLLQRNIAQRKICFTTKIC